MSAEERSQEDHSDRSDDARSMGDRISQARKEAGYRTAQDFSDALNVSVWTVRSWESGKSQPRYDMLDIVSSLTGRSKAWFLGEGEMQEGLDRALSELLTRRKARQETQKGGPETGVFGIPAFDEAAEEELQALADRAREAKVLIRINSPIEPAHAEEIVALHLALANLLGDRGE